MNRAAQLQQQISALSAELCTVLIAEQDQPGAPAPAYLTVKAFAARMSLSTSTIRRMIRDGMPVRRPRKRALRIPVAAAEAWISGAPEPERAAPVDAPMQDVR